MKVLFTGASSFTGFWFVRTLAAAGHEVVAVFQREREDYTDRPRAERVAHLTRECRAIWRTTFGDESFMRLVEREDRWDVFCHHAAEARDYRSPEFDVSRAFQANTNNVAMVLDRLSSRSCRHVVLTGSIFEGGEGTGSDGLPTVSPYGLSKRLTAEAFGFYCERAGLALGRFVIPNPFGPYEERRFVAHLMRQWLDHLPARVRTPDYVRDNIHVSLLAKAYADFVERFAGSDHGLVKINPSGYVESQGRFAERVAREMRSRIGLPCDLEMAVQRELDEPRVRVNTDVLDVERLRWNEDQAWDELARYYEERAG